MWSQDHADETPTVDETCRPIKDVLKILISLVVCAKIFVSFIIGVGMLKRFDDVGGALLPHTRPQLALKESRKDEERHGDDGVAVVLVE